MNDNILSCHLETFAWQILLRQRRILVWEIKWARIQDSVSCRTLGIPSITPFRTRGSVLILQNTATFWMQLSGERNSPTPPSLLHINIHSLYTSLEKFQFGYQEQLINRYRAGYMVSRKQKQKKQLNFGCPDSQVSTIQGGEGRLQPWRRFLPHKPPCI